MTNSHRAAIGAEVGTVTGQDGTPAGTGVVTVTAGGPADRAGLLAAARPGDQLTLSVLRGPQQLTMAVTLGELPAA